MQRVIASVLFCVFAQSHLWAEVEAQRADDLFVSRVWQTKDGLPQNSVNAIAQTADGYLWLGTFNGLVRFDGVRFTAYTVGNTPELKSDYITVLKVTPDNTLWIGTSGGGLTYFHAGKFSRVSEGLDLNGADILYMATDPNGILWAASMEDVFRWGGDKFVKVARSGSDLYPFRGMAFDKEGRLWLATGKGLRRFQNGEFIAAGAIDRETHRVVVDNKDGIWYFDKKEGLLRLQGASATVAAPLKTWPEAVFATEQGQVWLGGNGNPLMFCDWGKFFRFDATPCLSGHDVSSIYADSENNIWIGLDGGGLVRLRNKELKTYTVDQGLPSNNTVTVSLDSEGRLWIGNLGSKGGVSWLDPKNDKITPVPEWGSTWASSCYRTRDGKMWIGTFGYGIWSWENGVFEHHLEGPQPFTSQAGNIVKVLFEDRSGGFWIGTDSRGVECFRNGKVTKYGLPQGLSHNKVTSICQDATGDVWVGTLDGLSRISEDGTIQKFFRKDGLGASSIHALYVDSRGTLWIGTSGGGLSRYDGKRFITITTKEGLPNDVVAQILEDDLGCLWIGTNRGIVRLSLDSLKSFAEGKIRFVQSLSYGVDNGMVSEECGGGFQPACLKDKSGHLWFCTVGGLVVVDPSEMRARTHASEAFLEEAWIDGAQHWLPNSPKDSDAPLIVPPSSQTLEIKFTGIHLSAPERVIFRYRLENYDSAWVDAGTRRSAFYTRLPPGSYRFHVSAGNNEDVWNESGIGMSVIVQPAWWQTSWFYSCVALVGVSIVGGTYHLRVSQLKRQRAQKAEFSRRLIESQEAERQRISRELHDSLGLSFAVIKNRAYLALGQSKEASSVQEHIREICDISADAVQEVRQISHALRPPQLDRLGLTRTIETIVDQMAKSGDLKLEMSIQNIDDFFSLPDQINFLRVIQESLSNILKHARASSIELAIDAGPSHLDLRISDDGRGFDVVSLSNRSEVPGLGLMAIRERVEILAGQFEINSVAGEGTRLKIRIPKPKR